MKTFPLVSYRNRKTAIPAVNQLGMRELQSMSHKLRSIAGLGQVSSRDMRSFPKVYSVLQLFVWGHFVFSLYVPAEKMKRRALGGYLISMYRLPCYGDFFITIWR